MAYAEQHQVTDRTGNAHPVGLHFGPMSGLRKLPQGLTINGMDPHGDVWNARHPQGLYGAGGDGQPIEIAAQAQDPQTERDMVHLARGVINQERDLWPGNEGTLPPQAINQWANLARAVPGFRLNLPQEGPAQLPPEKVQGFSKKFPTRAGAVQGSKSITDGSVSGEMSQATAAVDTPSAWSGTPTKSDNRTCPKCDAILQPNIGYDACPHCGSLLSKTAHWQVVSLGELQQPGGVGATQEYNPVTDGPNPDQPPAADNAQNSPEQEVALETWVNYAVDMLNRGEPEEAVLANLAHDGCPNPEEILQAAQQQPVDQKPISDEIGQDPFKAPAPQEQTGQMESVSRQPPVMARRATDKRIRVKGSSITGIEIDRWEGQWGEGMVMIALDDGGTRNVSPEAIEEITPEMPEHPVNQIQQFIDSLPPVEPTRPGIEARVANLRIVRRACRDHMTSVGFSDQVKLSNMDSDAEAEIRALRESVGAVASESEMAYLSGQQTYRPHGLDLPGVERAVVQNEEFDSKIREAAAIFVAELDPAVIASPEATAYAAAMHAAAENGNVPEFVKIAEEHRVVRTDEFVETPVVTTETDGEGPAEALFV